jgi:hypothetical protein
VPIQSFSFETKDLNEKGEFSGLASVYGVIDQQNDVVDAGAFTKTLASGPERPLLWQHRPGDPIGLCNLRDTGKALALTAKLCLEIQQAKEAYALLRDGVVKGLSIGFQTIEAKNIGGVRHLTQLKLFEVSLVTFPALPDALVTGVKTAPRTKEIHAALIDMKRGIFEALEGKR